MIVSVSEWSVNNVMGCIEHVDSISCLSTPLRSETMINLKKNTAHTIKISSFLTPRLVSGRHNTLGPTANTRPRCCCYPPPLIRRLNGGGETRQESKGFRSEVAILSNLASRLEPFDHSRDVSHSLLQSLWWKCCSNLRLSVSLKLCANHWATLSTAFLTFM